LDVRLLAALSAYDAPDSPAEVMHSKSELSVLQEWFHFVDKEKQVRIRIDGKVDQMIRDAAELKQWTITEVRHTLDSVLYANRPVITVCICLICTVAWRRHHADSP